MLEFCEKSISLTLPVAGEPHQRALRLDRPRPRLPGLKCAATPVDRHLVDGRSGTDGDVLTCHRLNLAGIASLRQPAKFGNVDRPPAAVTSDVDVEAGHWSLLGGRSGLHLISTRSATRRFKVTVPGSRNVAKDVFSQLHGKTPKKSHLSGTEPAPTAAKPKRRRRSRIIAGAAIAAIVCTAIGATVYVIERKSNGRR